MRALIQKVTSASVTVDGEIISSIQRGLCVLVGLEREDTEKDAEWTARKISNIRLFEDGERRWDKSVKDLGLEVLSVSQFTLHAFLKGNKPDFHKAMGPDKAPELYENFLQHLRGTLSSDLVKDGRFGAMMSVQIVNDGPVTIFIDSRSPN